PDMLCPEEAAIINGFHGVPPQEKPEGWRSLGAVNRWLGWTLTRILGPLPLGGALGMASAALLGAAAGGIAGYIAGQRIANDLKASSPLRHRCLDCGLTF
ncbi:MAG: hypothetical protein M0Q95_19645, partial [Porticoccaceae bacterium]|nr:hypothetical protein [Porticoccaceae bacterium]